MGKTSRLTPLVGVLFTALMLAAFNIGQTPATNKPDKWATFITKHSNQVGVLVSSYLVILAGLALLGFLCVLRARMDGRMPVVAFASGVIAVAGICVAGGLNGSVAANILFSGKGATPSSGELSDYITSTAWAVFLVSAMLPLALCMLSLGVAAVRSRTLAAWIGWFAILTGVVLLAAVTWLPLFVLMLFTLAVGIALTLQRPKTTVTAASAA